MNIAIIKFTNVDVISHMATMMTDIVVVWRKHENTYPCTGSRVITSYERIANIYPT